VKRASDRERVGNARVWPRQQTLRHGRATAPTESGTTAQISPQTGAATGATRAGGGALRRVQHPQHARCTQSLGAKRTNQRRGPVPNTRTHTQARPARLRGLIVPWIVTYCAFARSDFDSSPLCNCALGRRHARPPAPGGCVAERAEADRTANERKQLSVGLDRMCRLCSRHCTTNQL